MKQEATANTLIGQFQNLTPDQQERILKDEEFAELYLAYQDQLYGEVKDNLWEWATNFVYTLDPHDKKNPVKQFPNKGYLKFALETWLDNQLVAVEKTRQMFITWVITSANLWLAINNVGQNIFFQSQRLEHANDMVARAEFIYDHLPEGCRPAARKVNKPSAKLIFPELNSTITAVPKGGDILRMHTASSIFSDECAFQEDNEDAYTAAKPTIDGGGRYTLVSTPNGLEFFYEICADEYGN